MTTSSPPAFTVRMVRELKGAPLACLILLIAAPNAVANEWLCMMSGYTDKTISQALKLLSSPEYQLAKRARGGWVFAKGFQMVLGEIDESRKNSDSLQSRNFSDSDFTVQSTVSRKNSVSTTTTIKDSILINESDLVVVVGRKNSDFDFENPYYELNLALCSKRGIGEPNASKISDGFGRLGDPITPEFIQAHIDSLRPDDTIGLAINRILNDELPRTWASEIAEMANRAEHEETETD